MEHHEGHTPATPGGPAHDRHEGHSATMFRDRFWLSLALSLVITAFSPMVSDLLGFTPPAFPGSAIISPLLGTAVFVYGGTPFLVGAYRELRDRSAGMMVLIALGISVAFAFSAAVTLGYPGEDLWWELATLVTIMLLGHWIEMRSISSAQGALKELAKLLPDRAVRLLPDGSATEVPVSELHPGDTLLLRPGARVPTDGTVAEGSSTLDESMITGESRPVEKRVGDPVTAGTVNGAGSVRVTVTRVGDETALAGIMRLVADAQASRSRAQVLADRAARLLTAAAIGTAALTAFVWALLGTDAGVIIERVVAVLVIACPHALGLAVPLVVAISTTLGARHGLLVRDRRGLEEARSVDTVVFDKTGTLTLAEYRVLDALAAPDVALNDAVGLAAAVERDSEHPVARAIVAHAHAGDVQVPGASGFAAQPGLGARATIAGEPYEVGGAALLAARGLEPASELAALASRAASAGRAATYLVSGGHVLAVFVVADAPRPESPAAVQALGEQGIGVVMLTGDTPQVARAVAAEIGIDRVLAGVLPADKAAAIRGLQAEGRRVAMVGDGVNDAPALVAADVGIAIGAGTEVAVEAGDIVLVRSDPRDVPAIISLSRATYRKMLQNLWWAAGYNIVAIPLAAGVLAPVGITLSPAVGAIFMSASTVIVAVNAQLLRRWER